MIALIVEYVCDIWDTTSQSNGRARTPPRGHTHITLYGARAEAGSEFMCCIVLLGEHFNEQNIASVRCLCVCWLWIYGRTLHIIPVWLLCLFSEDTIHWLIAEQCFKMIYVTASVKTKLLKFWTFIVQVSRKVFSFVKIWWRCRCMLIILLRRLSFTVLCCESETEW